MVSPAAERSPKSSRDFCLSVTVDFPDDIVPGPYDESRLNEMMALIKSMGASRVYWIYYGDIVPDSNLAGSIYDSHWATYGRQTIEALGEPLQAAVRAARKHALEIFGVLKPYYAGVSGTYPAGSPEAQSSSVSRIGGQLQNLYPFIKHHPEFRIRAKPIPHIDHLNTLPVHKIKLIKKNDAPTRIRAENIEIWTSPCNYRYVRSRCEFSFSESVEKATRQITDYYGNVMVEKDALVRVITLDGLCLDDPFFVIATNFKEGPADFRNTPLGMVEVFGPGNEKLPFVVATQNACWIKPRDFKTYGLEFDTGYGHLPCTLDLSYSPDGSRQDMYQPFQGPNNSIADPLLDRKETGGFIGIGRGRNEYLSGAPCEAYPEVRELWLGWVGKMLKAGVDGVDIRISGHSTLADDPYDFGFNEPVLKLYHDRYGESPKDDYILDNLSAIRGECFSDFIREASNIVRSGGARFHVHVHTEYFRPDPVFGQVNGFPANVYFDWKSWLKSGWLDGITLRTSWYEGAEDAIGGGANLGQMDTILQNSEVLEALSLAGEHGVPVQLNRYVGRAAGTDEYTLDIEKVFLDDRFAGLDVYEFFDLAHSDPNLETLTLVSDRYQAIRDKMKKL